MTLTATELTTDASYSRFARLIHDWYGINLDSSKKELVHNRLRKRLEFLNLKTMKEYLKYLEVSESPEERRELINLMSTNVTYFFREGNHFEFLKDELVPEWKKGPAGTVRRIWSAACSSGEEVWSTAMVMAEADPENTIPLKLLGTDVSSKMIQKANKAIYSSSAGERIGTKWKKCFLESTEKDRENGNITIRESLKKLVQFTQFNLMTPEYPFKNPLDLILCRNVMIYFDAEVRKHVIDNFTKVLKPGGILFIGHSESLMDIETDLEYVAPSIYKKTGNIL